MAKSGAASPARLLGGVGVGLLTLAVGVAVARVRLPEWEARLDAPASHFEARFAEIAEQAGLRLAPGRPRIVLSIRGREAQEQYRFLGDRSTAWLRLTRSALRVEVTQRAQGPSPTADATLLADFSLDGTVQTLSLTPRGVFGPWRAGGPATRALSRRLAEAALSSGESLSEASLSVPSGPVQRSVHTIAGARPPQHLLVQAPGAVILQRRADEATPAAVRAMNRQNNRLFSLLIAGFFGLLAVAAFFAALAIQRRVSFANGLVLAAVVFLSLRPFAPTVGFHWALAAGIAGMAALWTFLVWSCGESLLRTSGKEARTSLDALRWGRLGPRGGRSLLAGFACGAALGGAKLAVLAGLDALPGVWLLEPSIRLPLFICLGSPVAAGIGAAALVALCLGLSLRVVALRWAGLAAALAAAVLTTPVSVAPWVVGAGLQAVLAGALVLIYRHFGLTGLLCASLTSSLLPAAVYTGLHLPWTTAAFAVAAAVCAAIPVAGLVGLSRSAAAELTRMEPPVFVRRLEEAKRQRHEMGLLARMQQGLLQRRLPELPGWEIAARSVIANEAGGDLYDVVTDPRGLLWVAAGDVAGHGYSCAVAQAMTKAALVSLIGRHGSPAEILERADRVLRRAGPTRHFTTLALLRIDPRTGQGAFANAGHPPAYLVNDGGVRELAQDGLPLGIGPLRTYQEIPLALEPGTALVFCSDGLFEAIDADGEVYGFPRLGELLRTVSWRTADRILAALFDDWRRHLRTLLPRDDTTVVVLKRKAGIG